MDAANIVEAASNGASQAIPLVANIAAMLIAFVSFIEWLNSAVAWAGECVGQGESTIYALNFLDCSNMGATDLTFSFRQLVIQSLSVLYFLSIRFLDGC